MSTQTPRPPPAPVAAFLSPVLWRMETPDRFDMCVRLPGSVQQGPLVSQADMHVGLGDACGA